MIIVSSSEANHHADICGILISQIISSASLFVTCILRDCSYHLFLIDDISLFFYFTKENEKIPNFEGFAFYRSNYFTF